MLVQQFAVHGDNIVVFQFPEMGYPTSETKARLNVSEQDLRKNTDFTSKIEKGRVCIFCLLGETTLFRQRLPAETIRFIINACLSQKHPILTLQIPKMQVLVQLGAIHYNSQPPGAFVSSS